MWGESLAIAGGFILLAWSADRFVVGASALAYNLKVSPLIIGLTIVSLGTSAPEILVSAIAAFQGNPGIAVGNAVGSNIINTGLILGLTALVMPLKVHSSILRREMPVLVVVMAITFVLILDGILGRLDGLLLITGMTVMLFWVVRLATRARNGIDPMVDEYAEEVPTDLGIGRSLFWLLVGAIVLLVSSRLLVWGAVSVAREIGVSDLVIGLTIVALGTSLPELAASVMSALKNEHDIAIGNIIGSNIFNMLAVLGVAGVIHPVDIEYAVLIRDFPVMALLVMFVLLMVNRLRSPGSITRMEGAFLVIAFCCYQTLLYFTATV